MHEDYEDNYEDDDEHDYDHPSLNPYQWYYKFDFGPNTPISNWVDNIIQDMLKNDFNTNDMSNKMFPVNSWNPNTGGNSLQYLGSNYQGSPIWKIKYFAINKINTEYVLHLQSHAKHFVNQPTYYKGMFDILN